MNINIITVNTIISVKVAHFSQVPYSKYLKEECVLSLLFKFACKNIHNIKKTTEFLLVASKGIDLEVNIN